MSSHAKKSVRRSVTLRSDIDQKVRMIASGGRRSTNRVLEELIEAGLESKEAEKRRFFELADRLANSTDLKEQQSVKDELARLTFGS